MIGINHLGKRYERLANQMFQYAAIKGIAKNRGFTYCIPPSGFKDIDYVEEKIKENRAYSLEHREEILNYAQKFDWINVVKKHYIPNVKMVLSE